MQSTNEDKMLPMEVDVETVKSMLDATDGFFLIDCREEDEYATAKIDTAMLLPLSDLQNRAGELEPMRGRRVVVHCHHGVRSMQLVQMLRSNGFDEAQSMAGGIDAWSQQIDPSVPRY